MFRRVLTGLTLLPALLLCGAAPAQDRPAGARQDFDLVNKSGFGVVSFYISPEGKKQWSANVLGKPVLKSGDTARITFSPDTKACKWDMRATYDDNDVTELPAVDLCDVATVTLNP